MKLTGHVPALDGLRGVAICLVLLRHFTPPGEGHSRIGAAIKALANTGGAGVDLFFVLSGFLITGILLDAKGTANYFRNFYARRTLRIFPLYYAVLFVCFVLVPLVHPFSGAEEPVAHRQGWLWLYGANIKEGMPRVDHPFEGGWIAMDHFWSLAVEEHFYLVWPLLVFLIPRRKMVVVCGALIAAAMALRIGLFTWGPDSMAYYHWTPCRMDELAMGGLVALLAREDGAAAWLKKGAAIGLPILLLATALTWNYDMAECVFRGALLGLVSACLLIVVATCGPRHPFKVACNSAPMRFMGKYSYATYVLHPLLLMTVMAPLSYPKLAAMTRSGFVGVFLFLLIGFAVSIGAAWASWHLFEKHFLKLKRFFEYRKNTEPRAVEVQK